MKRKIQGNEKQRKINGEKKAIELSSLNKNMFHLQLADETKLDVALILISVEIFSFFLNVESHYVVS